MACHPRVATGGLAYHVLNRRVARLPLFEKPTDYAVPVQTDAHFLTVARYVEPNTLRAKLVPRAEAWQWSSLWRRTQSEPTLTAWLSDWPVDRPRNWMARVNGLETAAELEALRTSVQRGRPFGSEPWVLRMAKRLGLESTLRPRGWPKGF